MAQPRTDPKLDALARGRMRTLLLYCPFDRKVTRHARRGNELRLVCLDCGRSVDPPPGESESSTTIDLAAVGPSMIPNSPILDTSVEDLSEARSATRFATRA